MDVAAASWIVVYNTDKKRRRRQHQHDILAGTESVKETAGENSRSWKCVYVCVCVCMW